MAAVSQMAPSTHFCRMVGNCVTWPPSHLASCVCTRGAAAAADPRQQGNLWARAVQQRATVVRGRTSQVVRLESVYSEQKARPTLPSPVVRE